MTILLGLLGYPLEHSISPAIHQAALDQLGLPGEYILHSHAPTPDGLAGIADLLDQVRRGEITGLNVTIPHKLSVLPLLDELTPAARSIGAVNTIYRRGERLLGDNTDAPGFLADLGKMLDYHRFDSGNEIHHPPSALVLGAGGSARAVIYALLTSQWRVIIAARQPQQALELTNGFNRSIGMAPFEVTHLAAETLSSLINSLPQLSLIVNTTPLGMAPNPDTSPWPAGMPFPAGAFVYDLVYNPAETTLVRSARDAGLIACNGLGMLVEQAALAFEIWTGQPAPRQVMLRAARSAL